MISQGMGARAVWGSDGADWDKRNPPGIREEKILLPQPLLKRLLRNRSITAIDVAT
jgi:hypothetical protein